MKQHLTTHFTKRFCGILACVSLLQLPLQAASLVAPLVEADGRPVLANSTAGSNWNTLSWAVPPSTFASDSVIYKAYFKVDLSSLPEDAVVTGATFSILSNAAGNDDVNIYSIVDGVANEDYDVSTLTWDNAPGNTTYVSGADFYTNNGGMTSGADMQSFSFDSSTPSTNFPGNTIYSVALADLDFLNDDSNDVAVFVLTADAGDATNRFFLSSNSPGETGLFITYSTAIPEPSSALLAAAGLAGLALMRRRRD